MSDQGTTKKRERGIPGKEDAILNAAARLFGEHGFERTSTKMIASEAGVAEGTIYTYFPTKRHILLTFLERTLLNPLKDVFEQVKGQPDEVIIRAFVLNRLKVWEDHGDLLKAVLAQAFFDDELAEEFFGKILGPAFGMMEGFIAERVENGAFRSMDSRMAARALIGQILVTGMLSHVMPQKLRVNKTAEESASELTTLFLEGIRK